MGKCEKVTVICPENVKYRVLYDADYVKSIIFAVVIKDFRYG